MEELLGNTQLDNLTSAAVVVPIVVADVVELNSVAQPCLMKQRKNDFVCHLRWDLDYYCSWQWRSRNSCWTGLRKGVNQWRQDKLRPKEWKKDCWQEVSWEMNDLFSLSFLVTFPGPFNDFLSHPLHDEHWKWKSVVCVCLVESGKMGTTTWGSIKEGLISSPDNEMKYHIKWTDMTINLVTGSLVTLNMIRTSEEYDLRKRWKWEKRRSESLSDVQI